MSYVQGTKVRVTATVTDSNTGAAITSPTTLKCLIRRPDDTVVDLTSSITAGALPGEFYAIVDTAYLDGVYAYQFSTAGADGVTERSSFNVRKAIPAPV